MNLNSWNSILSDLINKDETKALFNKVDNEYNTKTIYPPKELVFNAFKNTSLDNLKVVIIGQDPYHGEGEANGMSFSVNKGIKLPPSLKNIYTELYDDLGIKPVNHGDLTKWAKEGVLLLNSTLTVIKDNPNSHAKIGWSDFTDEVIKAIDEIDRPIVFILWGNFARSKKEFIKNKKHYIIESAHPSPFSCRYGFFGSKPFSKCNEFLKRNNIKPIDWNLRED